MRKLLASIVIYSLTVALAPAQEKGPKIEGTWLLTGVESKVAKVPDESVAKAMGKMTFMDGEYEQSILGTRVEAGKYTIDPGKDPVAINIEIIDGKEKGKMQLGIFKVEGDKMTIALGKAGVATRPKSFEATEGIEVSTYRRGK